MTPIKIMWNIHTEVRILSHIVLILYVDDILVLSKVKDDQDWVKQILQEE